MGAIWVAPQIILMKGITKMKMMKKIKDRISWWWKYDAYVHGGILLIIIAHLLQIIIPVIVAVATMAMINGKSFGEVFNGLLLRLGNII